MSIFLTYNEITNTFVTQSETFLLHERKTYIFQRFDIILETR